MNVRSKGFTLIELLIVVAIIAILAAIAVPNFLEAQVRSKVSRAKEDIRTLATALESYAVDHNDYPPSLGQVGTVICDPRYNGHGDPRTYEWRTIPPLVTTPVAYITSIFTDPFKIGGVGSIGVSKGKPFANGDPFDIGYTYHNIKEYVEQAGWPPSNYYDDYGAWRMFSLGPDQTYNTPLGDADPSLGWIYDPTNGTISRGLIIRTQKMPSVESITYH
ncbi:prepilin-type N-terminal cleavage/methylation domain-containing protein [Candidatus Sumerlaeota bacterium]|nr:prepilin-type N-terminal cleavage/methylation domain-containing protein [Candidatus Sumerlaeota bacterium]